MMVNPRSSKKNNAAAPAPVQFHHPASAVDPQVLAEFKHHWGRLNAGLEQVFTQVNQSLSPTKYMEFYSSAYKCNLLSLNGDSEDVGADLYRVFYEFLVRIVTGQRGLIENLSGATLLARYGELWKQFSRAANVNHTLFNYLNRHYVKRHLDDNEYKLGDYDIYGVYNLCFKHWQDHLFKPLEAPIINAVYEQIVMERNGGRIDTSLIRNVLDSLVAMGRNDPAQDRKNDNVTSLIVYQDSFEAIFLTNTMQYYIIEAQEFLQQNNIIDYMKKVDQRMQEEKDRVDRYLEKSTLPKILEVIDKALIIEYIDRFRAEFDHMLANNELDNLKRMYNVVGRVDGALVELHQKLHAHMVDKGTASIKLLTTGPIDPRVYVNTVLDFYNLYKNILIVAFNNEQGFVVEFDKAIVSLINNNPVTEQANTSAKTSELLARYCDFLLRKSPKSLPESEIEDCLEHVMVFFKYIEDKDVFQKYYCQCLAKRIVNDVSASEDFEANMLAKLKNMCGFEYVSKLQRIYQDQAVSKELTATFRNYTKDKNLNLSFDLSVLVMANGVWPMPPGKCEVPQVLEHPLTEFQNFYNGKHNGRKLSYMNNLGRGEVVCNMFPRKYGFTVNTLQLIVLTMFNEGDAYTLQQIMDTLKLEQRETLPNVLMAMLKVELLKLEGGASFSPNTPLDTKVELNMKFTSRKMKIDLSKGTARTESKKEEAEVAQDVDEDRRIVIQAAIVRVMKMRKTLAHNKLIAEVITQLSNRFKPNVKMIKKCIDLLIDKEYLARKQGDRESYEYLS